MNLSLLSSHPPPSSFSSLSSSPSLKLRACVISYSSTTPPPSGLAPQSSSIPFSSHAPLSHLSTCVVYEVVLEKDLEIAKNKKEKYKSLALKARQVLSDDDTSSSDSNDEEYAMAVRDFKKFFRRRGKFVRQPYDDKRNFQKIKEDKKEDRRCFKCGDPNHFISDCPKNSSGDQKAFVVESWSDSGDDSKKEEICLMAHSNEVRQKVKLDPDEWIQDSSLYLDILRK
ncbi:zf-CCHC domain-containing protein [Tanacetum coccineum]|uniref:Zf-CCHC domain-containing protein n=1 Tax=Tanacetum coccineum TaxID=301880 RepID=A0ABQ5DWR3_9ASTR